MRKLILLYIFISLGISTSWAQQLDSVPLHETFVINSKILNEARTINVCLPKGYATSIDSLSVMYMPDGAIDEDFPHVANTLENLIAKHKIPQMILVGIPNKERRRDLTPTTNVAKDKKIAAVVGGAEKFKLFIKDELFPEINKRYRTNGVKSIIGESLAGLFVTDVFLNNTDMFDNYIAFDPSLWWNDHYLERNAEALLSKVSGTNKRYWFAGSDTKDIQKYTNGLAKTLAKASLPNLKWFYSQELKEQHNTIFRATKEKALIWTFN